MDKVYNHKDIEEKLYKKWEDAGYFQPEIHPDGKPYAIVLPPPNANGALHFGHAMFVIEDILIRYHRMLGDAALWLPGTDHAGIETQFVFEKKLKAEGKSRLDFDQETLYKMIWEYVEEHRGGIQNQLRKLGFSLDWSREKYTLDPAIVKLVHKTFKRMYDEKLVYRADRLVNFCTVDGTSFSDLEVVNLEKEGVMYYIKFPIKEGGSITVATTRPETYLGDVAVMVHPEDTRYKDMVGKTVVLPFTNREIPIVADPYVDMQVGTGAVKVTPSHDFNDYEIAKKHNLSYPPVIGFDGKMQNTTLLDGMYVKKAREEIVGKLEEKGLLEKTEPHKMVLRVCYKCKSVLEPLPKEQWFMNVGPLKKEAIDAVKNGQIKIHPKNFEAIYFQWLEGLRDWNISRQIVWGIRIPAWRCIHCSEQRTQNNELRTDWIITEGKKPEKCPNCGSTSLEQDADTFDTWFSSGQWPYIALLAQSEISNFQFPISNEEKKKLKDFDRFYPTAVMETGYDLLRAWVSRMIMFGLYTTKKEPFKDVLFHGLVNDPYGKKMSKSKGNVVNPLELIEQYGADAVRFALIYGNATGNDQSLSYTKLDAARKFSNKLWNIGRFIEMKRVELKLRHPEFISGSSEEMLKQVQHDGDKEWVEKVENLSKDVTHYIDSYQFNLAAEGLYEFIWHEFADKYIEDVKGRLNEESYVILNTLYILLLKLLHPFMPFITEEIYQKLGGEKSIMVSSWPPCL